MSSYLALFTDQQEIMADLSAAMRLHKAILLQSPTGSGKTAMAIYMILKCLEKISVVEKLKDRKIIFTVPRKDLMEQTSDSLRKYGIDHSFIADGKPYNPMSKVYIGMVPSMTNKIKFDKETGEKTVKGLPEAYIVLIDETHFGANSLGNVIDHYKEQGSWVIGLSATPWRMNGQGLGVWYDVMVKGKTVKWLIENNRLSNYDYYYGRTKPDLSSIKVGDGDYNKDQLAEFMEAQGVIISDCVNDYKSRCMGKLHIVRCASIKHSQMVTERFVQAGIKAVHVDGDTPMDERKRIFKAFAMREIVVLCFCDLLNFGFDLSQASGMDVCIESGSDMKPSKSLAAQMQFWGRMLRYKSYNAIINDHVNNYIEHGLPCSDREWTLESKKKKKGSGEKTIPTRQCEKCYCVHPPAPRCPQCGFEYPIQSRTIEEVDGEMEKMDKEAMKLVLQQKKFDNMREVSAAKSLDDLIQLGIKRGYTKPVAWASHLFNARELKSKKGK